MCSLPWSGVPACSAKLQTAGGFNAPGSQSQQAGDLATTAFGRDAGDVVVLYSSPTLRGRRRPSAPTVTANAGRALPGRRAVQRTTYWSTGSASFVSAGGHETYAVLELNGATDTSSPERTTTPSRPRLAAPGLQTSVGGLVPTNETISNQTTKDIKRAESLSFPILLVLLLLIFGSLAAASLPLGHRRASGILGSFTALRVLTLFTPVSIFSANITTILGLGLAIDYGLFMVSRFREELRRQGSVEDAVARTMATAGRTVAFSGVTVAVALASLMLFPETFLRSMGYGGVLTVLVDHGGGPDGDAGAVVRARPEGQLPPDRAGHCQGTGARSRTGPGTAWPCGSCVGRPSTPR